MNLAAVQLSHEELILTLALLDLPAPLALGPEPTAGYDPAGLGAALTAAAGSLAARGLLAEAGPGASPVPVEPLASLVRAAALAESQVVLAERRGERRRAAHIGSCGSIIVLHTSPQPGVHRLAPLADATAAADQLAAIVQARPASGALPAFAVDAAVLAEALDDLEAGRGQAAYASLCSRGIGEAEVAAFLAALGPAPGRFAIGAVRALHSPGPTAEGALALSGMDGAWWARSGSGVLNLNPVCPAELRRELDRLAATLTAPVPVPPPNQGR